MSCSMETVTFVFMGGLWCHTYLFDLWYWRAPSPAGIRRRTRRPQEWAGSGGQRGGAGAPLGLPPAPSLPGLVLPRVPTEEEPLLEVALVADARVGAYYLAALDLWGLTPNLACLCYGTVGCHETASRPRRFIYLGWIFWDLGTMPG